MKLDTGLYRLKSFWRYYRRAQSIHHIDSPYLFELLRPVLNEKRWYYAFDELEPLRRNMKQSAQSIKRTDWGKSCHKYETTIGSVAKSSLTTSRECRMLFRLAVETSPERLLELGTSLGLTTLYFSRAVAPVEVHTIEGDPVLNKLAGQHFQWMNAQNIVQHEGRFEKKLPEILDKQPPFDYTFTDGHHTKDATLNNVSAILQKSASPSIHIIHDIYHSPEMETAWDILKSREEVDASVDFYQFGLLIKNPDLAEPVHHTLIPWKWKPWSIGLFR